MPQQTYKILVDATPLIGQKTGIGYFTERLLLALAENNQSFEITAFYFNFFGRKKDKPPKHKNITYREIRFFPPKLLGLLRRFGLQLPVEFFIKWQRFDFILYTNFVSLPSLRRTPSAVAIHDLSFLDHPEFLEDQNLSFLKRFVPNSVKRSSFILTISEFSKSRINKYFGGTPVVTVPIPYESLELNGSVRNQVLKITKEKYILYIGTIEPRKNLKTLIDAFDKLPSKIRKESSLVIAGKMGWKVKEVERSLRKKSPGTNIHMLGYITNAERDILYKNAHAICIPSHYEGFGMPILESQQYNKQLLLSDIPVFREVAGNSAIYFNQKSVNDLASRLESVLSVRSKTVHKSKHSYSWKLNASRIIKMIKESAR